jgi:uncharacterized membrane protein YhaH (DUF805 family)
MSKTTFTFMTTHRNSRKGYWLASLSLLSLATAIMTAEFLWFGLLTPESGPLQTTLHKAIIIGLFISAANTASKRLNDIGRSAWFGYVLALLMMAYNKFGFGVLAGSLVPAFAPLKTTVNPAVLAVTLALLVLWIAVGCQRSADAAPVASAGH